MIFLTLLLVLSVMLLLNRNRVLRFITPHTAAWSLEHKVVLITGAAQGIGQGLAIQCANAGAILVLLDINLEALEITASAIRALCQPAGRAPPMVHVFQCDVSDSKHVHATIKAAKTALGPNAWIHVVVNNAGVVSGKPFLELRPTEVIRTFGVNTLSHFWMNQALLPDMLARDEGFIVTISSVMSTVGAAGLTDYCASKWAATGFHESLRMELRRLNKRNIKTLLVCPYVVNTGMFGGLLENSSLLQHITPMLNTDRVVANIFEAMQAQDTLLIGCGDGIYRLLYPWMAVLVHMLPPAWMDATLALLGGCNGMDTFHGHRLPQNNNNTVSTS